MATALAAADDDEDDEDDDDEDDDDEDDDDAAALASTRLPSSPNASTRAWSSRLACVSMNLAFVTFMAGTFHILSALGAGAASGSELD